MKRKNLISIVSALCLISAIIGGSFVYFVYGQTASTFWITEGVYPNPVDFTVWEEGAYCFAKNGYGQIPSWGINTNSSLILQNCNNVLNASVGGKIGIVTDITLSGSVLVSDGVHFWGLGWDRTTITAGNNQDEVMFYGDKVSNINGNDDIGFHYLGFDGNTAGQTSPQNLVTISNADNSIIEYCKFTNIGRHAVLWSQGGTSGAWVDYGKFLHNLVDATNADKDNIDLLGFGYHRQSVWAYNTILCSQTNSHNAMVSRACNSTRVTGNTLINTPDAGIRFETCWGTTINDNVLINSTIGAITISNNSVAYLLGGFPRNNIITNNYINLTETTGMALITDHSTISNNQIHFAGTNALEIYGSYNTISENTISNSDQGNAGEDGILIGSNSDYNKIVNNDIYDDQTVSTMDYAIRTVSTANHTEIIYNTFTNMQFSANLILNGVNHKLEGNTGYVTENSGNATLATGNTVSHGLAGIPTCVTVTAGEGSPTDIYLTAIGANTFTINFGGGGSKIFYWSTEYKP